MIQKQDITQLVEQFLSQTASQSYLISVTVSNDNTIVITLDNDQPIDIDECAALNRYLNDHLDRDAEDYDLEVGSAGLTAPLQTLRQYAKWKGQTMEVMVRDGRKLRGTLGDADAEGFDLTWTTQERVADPATGKLSKKKQDVEHHERLLHKDVNRIYYNF